ncbi:hypothetical protein CA267_004625 [Alteromonas pelagimontana]|uniref:Lipoprotein n=1 Tax=Alteromonas pelagimontana TaxID=1858656 RepID=A0A6M4MAC4_9ALTE|nr:hypothetical protein [Alteromonas pelagimontana]QJR80113.1 hypothetical protein CA267_004625 [Alteromonas pelagimontana]
MKGKGSLIFLVLFLAGCASQPTVYLYGKYLSDEQKTALIQQLRSKEYKVKLNDFDFPTAINQKRLFTPCS